MIKTITIKGTASFDDTIGVTFSPTLINFIYGSNGSGKTAFSNVIANCSKTPNCILDWGLSTPLQTLVYNKTFIEENFEQSSEVKGIFTFGNENKTEIDNIKAKHAEIELKEKTITTCRGTLEQEKSKLETIENTFSEKCWAVHKKHVEVFIKAFELSRGSKERFKEKVITEFASNKQPPVAYSELESKANALLNSVALKVPEVTEFILPDFKTLQEDPIFQTRIIGKDDVDIAKMILKLNNSDWVKQGMNYFKVNDNFCPFCQRPTDEDFRKQLDEYFDESYSEKIQALKTATDKYNLESDTLLKGISKYSAINNQFIDLEALTNLKNLIASIYQKNLLSIEKKIKEPTLKIEPDSIIEHINKLKEITDKAISKTKEHNKLIDNFEVEKRLLISKIWAFVINELKTDIATYKKEKDAIDKATQAFTTKISSTETEIRNLKVDIQTSEGKIASIKPTIDAINKTLSGFGFVNFYLAEGKTPGSYKVIRENGADAKDTLSEGEKTFITFLYFYHLTSGGLDANKITTNKVLVVDDPISSLDSTVLFIVSNLVRCLITACRENKSTIKQIFILTHNVYFHKEVTFKKRQESSKGESFWILRKADNHSAIQNYPDNPVQNSYDLLWQEIRDPSKINTLTVPNTLRRILEYYFKILGKIKDDELLNKFEGEEKVISNALLSWINDGSHFINDDIFVSADSETVNKYLRVFEKIFQIENQIEHYKMMMKVA